MRGVRPILAHPHTPEVRLLHHLKTSNRNWIEARIPKNFWLAYVENYVSMRKAPPCKIPHSLALFTLFQFAALRPLTR
jgi:hypothetical protein